MSASRGPSIRPVPLRARLAILWARILGSPRFHRFAAAFPFTRPVALRRSSQVFDLCAGFVYTQTLASCLELGILDFVSRSPRRAVDVAEHTGLDEGVTRGLLDAATSIGLLRRFDGDLFVLGRHGAPLIGNRELAAVVAHNRILYSDLERPLDVLRGSDTELARYWPYAAASSPSGLSDTEVAPYSAFMAASQPLIADEVMAHDPFDGVGSILDVGGGEGAFLEAVGHRYADPTLHLFDLPAVAGRARARFDRLGWRERTVTHGGDFLGGGLPDVDVEMITLVRVLHDLDDDGALELLRKIRGRLRPGRRLLIAEPMSGVRGAPRVGDAYFFWYLRALGRGRARTPREIGALLSEAGFSSHDRPRSRNPVIAVVLVATA